ncbi:ADP-ribosylation factor-like protein 16 isoform X4 [Bubalus bubalis]|uniref:ADP-ribosylation factor-like protein 16 isoform X4 n=1 Tax=Bubalus bubalis TaxID=89462 RepID=UPI000DBCA797|nr:ADP-ribosylation factor-like protein 16 isoform X4 [Bubalus bubalis]
MRAELRVALAWLSELRLSSGAGSGMCLLLGATGVGKSLLVKRLQKLSSRDGKGDLGDPPPTRPTVGTNLTDIVAQKKITIRELGGCMGPIWSSYYGNCHSLLFMVDASNPTQLSASCVQLLGLLSAEELAKASVLILFNKMFNPYLQCVQETLVFLSGSTSSLALTALPVSEPNCKKDASTEREMRCPPQLPCDGG